MAKNWKERGGRGLPKNTEVTPRAQGAEKLIASGNGRVVRSMSVRIMGRGVYEIRVPRQCNPIGLDISANRRIVIAEVVVMSNLSLALFVPVLISRRFS
jgi:hypothetical protein